MHNKPATQPQVFLKEWRMLHGLSQTEIAKKMNASKSEVSRLEGSKRKVSMSWLERYSSALGIEREQLFSPPTVTMMRREQVVTIGEGMRTQAAPPAPAPAPAPAAPTPSGGVGEFGLSARQPYMFIATPDGDHLLIDVTMGRVVAKLLKV